MSIWNTIKRASVRTAVAMIALFVVLPFLLPASFAAHAEEMHAEHSHCGDHCPATDADAAACAEHCLGIYQNALATPVMVAPSVHVAAPIDTETNIHLFEISPPSLPERFVKPDKIPRAGYFEKRE